MTQPAPKVGDNPGMTPGRPPVAPLPALRWYPRAELERRGPHDLGPDDAGELVGVLEVDMPGGRELDLEVRRARDGTVIRSWRDAETGREIAADCVEARPAGPPWLLG